MGRILITLLAGSLLVYALMIKTTGGDGGYTAPYRELGSHMLNDLQNETGDAMDKVGARPSPRGPINSTSPEQPSDSGTTTTSATKPMWVKEATSSGEERWKASEMGAPMTSLWDKKSWSLKTYGDEGAILTVLVRDSSSPTGNSIKEILWDGKGGKWLIHPDGVNKKPITIDEEDVIVNSPNTLELGVRPVAPTSRVHAVLTFTP